LPGVPRRRAHPRECRCAQGLACGAQAGGHCAPSQADSRLRDTAHGGLAMAKKSKKAAARRAAKQAAAATWGDTLACVATYNILEGDQFLDQFEDSEVPFDEAGELKVRDLRFFPRTTTNANIIEALSLDIAMRFLRHLVKTFTNRKQDRNKSTQELIEALAVAFRQPDTTLTEIATLVDALFKFPDEA
jgi:hypothetical protein